MRRLAVAFGGLVTCLAAGLGVVAGAPAGAAADPAALLVSMQADRGNAQPLQGASLSGPAFVFVSEAPGVSRVRFWLDDPERSNPPVQVEKNAPWDFEGTATDGRALPFAVDDLGSGSHEIRAVVDQTDGARVELVGTFQVGGQTQSLTASPATVDLAASSESPVVTGPLNISAADPVTVTLSTDRPWLSLSPGSGNAPLDSSVRADATGLAPGSHTGSVTATAPGYPPLTVPVTLAVTGPPPGPTSSIQFSTSNTRSPSAPLEGATVSGNIYAFLPQAAGIARVQFWIDDPTMSGNPYRTEGNAPYDLQGGTATQADAYDTRRLSDGTHRVTARVERTDGTTSATTASFEVANIGPSLSLDRTWQSVVIDERRQPATLTPRLSASSGTPVVSFASSVSWLSVNECCAVLPATMPVEVDTAGLEDGTHIGTVEARAPGYASASFTVEVLVDGTAPTQIHLAWVDDPTTSVSIVWRTADPVHTHAQYRRAGDATWITATGAPRTSGGSGVLHEVRVGGLTPGTDYEYRVPGTPPEMSPVRSFRTAPAAAADFDVVYMADTGIIGRRDGLTTGTREVIDRVAAMKPLAVLAGGDYAYFNTDTRFARLDDAIDAWFRQMQPIASQSVLMPTYGNHEVLLKEGFAPWAARFATPEGFDGRRSYSFDVGPVHFISVLAVKEKDGLPPEQLAWLEADLQAAVAAGRPWIVPFMHVSAFADGRNHPANLNLRAQLGPLFERYNVDLVLASHDQSYERTYPLVGVPSSITPTSTNRNCVAKNDGTTWAKISPAGKLSNQNSGFSQWRSSTVPRWTAVRNNTLHHIGRLRVAASGDLTLDVLGYTGRGDPAALVDRVRFSAGGC